ncbi:NAD(P)-dependent oxidoreductase [Nonomuraea sp. NPDC049725]|uniref:NAD-dependent epimerase/dehydratase family protein n=1 Tax=Nonomuraea sp. NPDC049725 TaxID=3154508 RepID=UPI003431862E
MTRYLITGATGFVGQRLTRIILARGHAVIALARPSARAQALRRIGAEVIDGDLRTGAGLRAAVAEADRVIHLAALVKARTAVDYWAVNRDGSARLARELAAMAHPPRLVVCSSLAAAGPLSHYGASKLGGERAVREHADRVQTVVLRPGIVYGPGEPGLIPALIPMVRSGLVVKAGFGPRRYCLLYVDDLCAALLAAAELGTPLSTGDPRAGVYAICDGRSYDWPDICSALARALGCREPAILPMPMTVIRTAARLAELAGRLRGGVPAFNSDKTREMSRTRWVCPAEDVDTAVRELGYSPSTPLHRGLIAAVRAHTPSPARGRRPRRRS